MDCGYSKRGLLGKMVAVYGPLRRLLESSKYCYKTGSSSLLIPRLNGSQQPLSLAYINRLGQYQVPALEFYETLTSCQAFETYFENERNGHGAVRNAMAQSGQNLTQTKSRSDHYLTRIWLLGNFTGFEMRFIFLAEHFIAMSTDTFCIILCTQREWKSPGNTITKRMAYLDYIDGYYSWVLGLRTLARCWRGYSYGPESIYRRNPNIVL
jgi:hypothetical protein